MSSFPSTSSGRTEKELSAAFTAEFTEASGRTEKELSLSKETNSLYKAPHHPIFV
jgi:hypothetical protein